MIRILKYPFTQEHLQKILYYDKETGIFVWKKTNKKAGSFDVYQTITIDYKPYSAHRLAWYYVYGEIPKGVIDHIDHNKFNNAINNLRDVTQQENMQNIIFFGESKVKGVHKHGNNWRATHCTDERRYNFGTRKTIEEAEQLYNYGIAHLDEYIPVTKSKNKKAKNKITQNELSSLLIYDENGHFYSNSGKIVGTTCAHGYRRIKIHGITYYEHVLAILYVTGQYPPENMVVDHINHIRDDNRYENLRVVTKKENNSNKKSNL